MKILVAGASGLIGTALRHLLEAEKHSVFSLAHSAPDRKNVIHWNPLQGDLDLKRIEGFDAFVNLAGENIASWRWTEAKKKEILDSRTAATSMLCKALAKLSSPPKVIVNASAIGYYGSRGNEILDETSSPGTGFLTSVCKAWEAAAQPAKDAGIRLAILRFGVVLSPEGGALGKMLTPFKLGLGGKIGRGNQYMSWIALEDVTRAVLFCLNQELAEGPINIVSPQPVTNAEFTETLGKVLNRPTFFTIPEPIVRVAFGEMGEEMLLSSTRVVPKKLQQMKYTFKYPDLEAALKTEIK